MARALTILLALPALQEDPSSFAKDQRLTAAYYYYSSGPEAHHAAEFLEMGRAGVEIALVPFQAGPEGLDPLVAALDGLEKDSKSRPRLALFLQPGAALDLGPADLFYARVPKRHWALIDGRPLVWLAPAPPGPVPDRAAFAQKRGRLARPPYLVAEISWKDAPADRTYAWGGTRGFAIDLPVVSVGPGSRNRGDGTFYERTWYKAIRLEPRLVAIESWNGALDGVSETPERKRKYLDATRRFVRDFKVNEKFVLPKGKWTPATQVAYSAVYTPHDQGLRPVTVDDGLFEEVRLRGFEGLTTKENKKGSIRRLCFDVDDSFCYFEKRPFEVAVEFLDLGEGTFTLEYDSGDRTLPAEQRVVKSAGEARFTGSGDWRTESFQLPDAVFGNGQPGGSDFRISVDQRGITVRSVIVLHR